MKPETERRLAALIMEEAGAMRQRAEREGVGAYLAKPRVKARPNRQFLTAMVRGVQHANRIVDMDEMWRQRELENKATRDACSRRSRDEERERRHSHAAASPSASSDPGDGGLRDEDLERFLHSKVKRGRGAVGSRMDEPGPYRAHARQEEECEERIARPVLGPALSPNDGALGSTRESKRHKKKSSRDDSSDSDEDETKDRKRRRKEKRKLKELDKHSKKKKSRH